MAATGRDLRGEEGLFLQWLPDAVSGKASPPLGGEGQRSCRLL